MAAANEQRAEERFPANANSACSFVSPVVEDFGPVRLKNISLKGIGLITSRKVEPGSLLAIKLVNPLKKFSKTALVRVAHATPQIGGTFLVGGDWDTPLTYEELCILVM